MRFRWSESSRNPICLAFGCICPSRFGEANLPVCQLRCGAFWWPWHFRPLGWFCGLRLRFLQSNPWHFPKTHENPRPIWKRKRCRATCVAWRISVTAIIATVSGSYDPKVITPRALIFTASRSKLKKWKENRTGSKNWGCWNCQHVFCLRWRIARTCWNLGLLCVCVSPTFWSDYPLEQRLLVLWQGRGYLLLILIPVEPPIIFCIYCWWVQSELQETSAATMLGSAPWLCDSCDFEQCIAKVKFFQLRKGTILALAVANCWILRAKGISFRAHLSHSSHWGWMRKKRISLEVGGRLGDTTKFSCSATNEWLWVLEILPFPFSRNKQLVARIWSDQHLYIEKYWKSCFAPMSELNRINSLLTSHHRICLFLFYLGSRRSTSGWLIAMERKQLSLLAPSVLVNLIFKGHGAMSPMKKKDCRDLADTRFDTSYVFPVGEVAYIGCHRFFKRWDCAQWVNSQQKPSKGF